MKKAVEVSVAVAILLAGCGSGDDANRANLGAAIGRYLEQKGTLCLPPVVWPVDVDQMSLRLQKPTPTSMAGRMAALEAAGLAKGADLELERVGRDGMPDGLKLMVRRYVLTDAAKPFQRQREVIRAAASGLNMETETVLCWGRMALEKVVDWSGLTKLGGQQLSLEVKYHYRIEGLADWAKKPEIRVSFPSVAILTEDAGRTPLGLGVKSVGRGWEAEGLDP